MPVKAHHAGSVAHGGTSGEGGRLEAPHRRRGSAWRLSTWRPAWFGGSAEPRLLVAPGHWCEEDGTLWTSGDDDWVRDTWRADGKRRWKKRRGSVEVIRLRTMQASASG